MRQYLIQSRLANKDMHTLYEHAFTRLEELSSYELARIARDEEISRELKSKANSILWKRIDPLDKDTVEV